jgi:hypothetical protein
MNDQDEDVEIEGTVTTTIAELPRTEADTVAEQLPATHPIGETEDNEVVSDEEERPAAKAARVAQEALEDDDKADPEVPAQAEETQDADYDQLLADTTRFQSCFMRCIKQLSHFSQIGLAIREIDADGVNTKYCAYEEEVLIPRPLAGPDPVPMTLIFVWHCSKHGNNHVVHQGVRGWRYDCGIGARAIYSTV